MVDSYYEMETKLRNIGKSKEICFLEVEVFFHNTTLLRAYFTCSLMIKTKVRANMESSLWSNKKTKTNWVVFACPIDLIEEVLVYISVLLQACKWWVYVYCNIIENVHVRAKYIKIVSRAYMFLKNKKI